MNTYSAYKDSGEQWLGQIPEHWEVRKLKYVLQLRKKIVGSDAKKYDPLSLTLKGVIKRDIENPTGKFPTTFDSYQEVNENDFIFCNFDNEETPRAVGLSPYRGMITGAYDVLRRIDEHCNDRFLFYYFLWIDDAKRFKPLYKGLRKTIPLDSFLSYKLALPPKVEQEAMVAYLDEQTGKIDAAIEREQKMIDLLEERKQIIIQHAVTKGLNPNAPMKESGIDWIGEMPEGWEVKRMKHLIKFINGYAFDSGQFTIDGDVCVIRISNIVEGHIDYSSVVYYKADKRLEPYKSQVGDLLIAMSGATTGKVGFDLIGGAYINQRVGAIRSNHQKWIYYWLNTPLFTEYINLFAIGSAQPNISSTGICNFKITCPSEEEQQAIVAYLDDKLSSINKAIAAKNHVITLLQERKQIIINEVVTGKIKVS